MPKMPKKQRKNKKREEKKKQMKALSDVGETTAEKIEQKKWGQFYILVFVAVAILGAAMIVLNV